MSSKLLEGKVGVVVGVANKRSIAFAIAKAWHEAGAKLIFNYQGERLKDGVLKLIHENFGEDVPVYDLDVSSDESVNAFFERVRQHTDKVDCLLHSVAFAPKEALGGSFLETGREAFKISLDISAYSLVALSRAVEPMMSDNGSILAMSYLGSEKVVPNYNLRCLSITDLPSATIFAAPTAADPVPANSFASFLDSMGRVEIIWYPFSDNPWLHTWQVAPTKPSSSIAVSTPFNYPFADYVPDGLQNLITHLVNGDPSLTPAVGQMAARVTAFGLDGENWAGVSGTYPVSRDIWGPSKNSLLYIQATTLRVT